MDSPEPHNQEPKQANSDINIRPSPTSTQKTLLQISDFLPPSSAALLALCNKHLSSLLGPQSWKSVSSKYREHEEERFQFLALLSRDLPLQHACHGCLTLHRSSSILRPGDSDARYQPTRCVRPIPPSDFLETGIIRISDYSAPYYLRFAHVQLASKRHQHGPPHGISLQDLNFTELVLIDDDSACFFTVEPMINSESGELLLRSQEWILSSRDLREDFERRRVTHGACQHLMTYNGEFGLDDTLTALVK
ncbi:hypothetical protein BKA64DRAFT_705288 [Cadophora sp. MPI-SDFR-AT-0126]|nr:hypothetical protein BKA64DRAFT_705288 [Leotiomycetes sp. MPI-SDFR-AT-0126]